MRKMKKINKRMTKKNKRTVLIIVGIVILLLLILSGFIKNNKKNTSSQWNSLQELLARFNCTYIKERNSGLENVKTDIYLEFGRDLYTENRSNERYFVDIVQAVAKFKEYENFRMMDEKKKIEIIAIANEEKTFVSKIYINGDSNYYGNKASMEALENGEEQKITKMNIKSNVLLELIQNDWRRKDVNFGTRESIFEDYWYYLDEGMEVRTIAAKVYNIVFRGNYKGEIVEGIKVDMLQKDVINKLGVPTFGAEGDQVIGYKGERFYLFFSDLGISIYPVVYAENTDEFIKCVKSISENTTVAKLLDSITNIWGDYDKYEYNLENYICLRYSLKGVQIQFNLENNNGIVFNNNYHGGFGNGLTRQDLMQDESKVPSGFFFKDEDLVYTSELERYEEDELCRAESIGGVQTEDFNAIIEKKAGTQKNLRVVSKTQKYANSDVELDREILSFLWIDNTTLVYSVKQKGIYVYYADSYIKKNLLETKEDCKIIKYENGKLYYNDTSIKIK